MKRNAEYIIGEILKHEGGFVDHPADPGGATNKGITIATFRRYIKRSGTVADLKAMTTAQAITVYRRQYWDKVRGDDLPSGVDYTVVDFAVNSGPMRAARYLQEAVGVVPDGQIGPQTLAAAKVANQSQIITRINDDRLAFMKRIQGGKLWRSFGRGWQRRVDGVRAGSLALVDSGPVQKIDAPNQNPIKKENQSGKGFFAAIAAIFAKWIKK